MAYSTKIRLRDQYVRKDGKTNFQLVVYINRVRKYYPIDVYIEPKYWNGTKVLAINVHNKEFNKILKEVGLKAENCIIDIINEGKELNFQNFEEKYYNINDKELTVADAFDKYIEYYSSDKINKATTRIYKSQKNKFIEFAGSYFLLKNVNQEFYMKYRHFLVNEKMNSQNTIVNSLKKLKAIINFSVKMNFLNENNLQFVTEKNQEVNRQSLSLVELEQLENLLYSNKLSNKLHNVLVLFLFSCYTGIRFGDIQSLTGNNIKDNFINFVQQKIKHETQRELSIPITKRCDKLLKTYLEITPNQKIFHKISNQKSNEYLKLIFLHPEINIDRQITFHSARHTFAMLALDFQLPIEYLQHLLGHSDIKTTKIYGKYQKELLQKLSKQYLDY